MRRQWANQAEDYILLSLILFVSVEDWGNKRNVNRAPAASIVDVVLNIHPPRVLSSSTTVNSLKFSQKVLQRRTLNSREILKPKQSNFPQIQWLFVQCSRLLYNHFQFLEGELALITAHHGHRLLLWFFTQFPARSHLGALIHPFPKMGSL